MSEDSTEIDPIAAAVADARARHPTRKRLYGIDTPVGILVLGVPRVQEYEIWQGLTVSEDKADNAKAPKVILLACAVEPTPAELAKRINDPEGYPGLPMYPPLRTLIHEITGAKKADTEKK